MAESETTFKGHDRLSKVATKIGRAFDNLRESIDDTADETDALERGFITLGQVLDENRQDVHRGSKAYAVLHDTIEDVVPPSTIADLQKLERSVRDAGEEAGISGEALDRLERQARKVGTELFSASISVDKFTEEIREMYRNGEISSEQMRNLERAVESVADEGDIHSLRRLKEQIGDVGMTSGMTSASLNHLAEKFDEVTRAALAEQGALDSATASTFGLDVQANDTAEAIEDMRRELRGAVADMTAFDLKALGTVLAFEAMDVAADDTAKEFDRFRKAVDDILPDNPITTLNLGPVNISLQEMGSTIVSLVTFIGPLIMTIVGLTSALLALVAAVGSFIATGLLGFLEEIDRMFTGIENKAEALEALMSVLGDLFRWAFEPLFGASIGGEGPIDFFVSSLRGAIMMARDFAELMRSILSGPSGRNIANSIDRITTALFTAGSGPTLAEILGGEQMGHTIQILTDFLVFLINSLPAFIAFSSEITNEVAPAIASIGSIAIPFFAQLIRVGSELINMLNLLVVIMGTVIGVFMKIFDIFDAIFFFIDLGEAMENVVAAGFGLVVGLIALNSIVSVLTTSLVLARAGFFILSGAMQLAAGTTALYSNGLWGLVSAQTTANLLTRTYTASIGTLVVYLQAAIAHIIMKTNGLWGLVSAETAATFASGKLSVAVWGLITSLTALEAVLWSLGIGAIIALIGFLIYAMFNWESAVDMVTGAWEGLLGVMQAVLDTFLEIVSLGVIDTPTYNTPKNRDNPWSGNSSGGGPAGMRQNVNVTVQGNVDNEAKFARRVGRAVDQRSARERRRTMGI